MPKKPRQIHLARNVSQKFFELYAGVSACRARVRALANQYETVFDDGFDAQDPYIDHEYVRDLGSQIIDAQKQVLRRLSIMDDYSKRTGYSADPVFDREVTDKLATRRHFLYATDYDLELDARGRYLLETDRISPRKRTKPTKKVNFVETEPASLTAQGEKFLRPVTVTVGGLAHKAHQAVSPLRLGWPDAPIVAIEAQPAKEKSERKRLSSEDHYKGPHPTKYLKIWHENVWPEAYNHEDVGNGLNRPITKSELDEVEDSVLQVRRLSIHEDNHKSTEECSNSTCTDIVIYQQKAIVAMPALEQQSNATEKYALKEIKNGATSSQTLGSRAMAKLQLPCSMQQASMLESKGAVF